MGKVGENPILIPLWLHKEDQEISPEAVGRYELPQPGLQEPFYPAVALRMQSVTAHGLRRKAGRLQQQQSWLRSLTSAQQIYE